MTTKGATMLEYDRESDDVAVVPMEPEQGLLLAVIQQALTDALVRPTFQPRKRMTPKYRAYRRKVMRMWRAQRAQALAWLLEERDPRGLRPMSLDWCCAMVGNMNPARIRQRVNVTLGRVQDARVRPYTLKGAA